MTRDAAAKFRIQELQYEFPYHYIPHFDREGTPLRVRHLRWGFEYLCYQRHIRNLVESLQPGSAIEVGCGDGYLIGSLSADIQRVGVDLSEQAIRFARAFHPDVNFVAGDARTIDRQFDVVLAVEVLEHIPENGLPGFIATLSALLGPGGSLIVSVPSDVVPVHPKHHRHYSESLLRSHVLDHAPELQLERFEHVYAPPAWLEPFQKLTCNRFLVLEMPVLNALIWKHLWSKMRAARAGKGRHIVGLFKRRA